MRKLKRGIAMLAVVGCCSVGITAFAATSITGMVNGYNYTGQTTKTSSYLATGQTTYDDNDDPSCRVVVQVYINSVTGYTPLETHVFNGAYSAKGTVNLPTTHNGLKVTSDHYVRSSNYPVGVTQVFY